MRVKTEYNKESMEAIHILDFGSCVKLNMTTEEHNCMVLDDFYKAIEWLLKKNYDEYREVESNTINPVQQNAFIPLRVYKVLKNGHYRTFKIYSRFFGGICITES